jgi:hypothetical protein
MLDTFSLQLGGNMVSRGPGQQAIQASIRTGARLSTPGRGSPFSVARIDDKGIVLLFGAKETPTPLTWHCLEGAIDFLRNKGWVEIGTLYDTSARPGTLDSYLKGCMKRATAGWVAALFEAAGLVQIDRSRPARVRLLA